MTVEQPDSLPARAYLLSFDRERRRLGRHSSRRHVCAAAALADLWLTGHVVADGKHVTATGPRPPADPVLRDVWQRIRDDKPRTWRWWISRAKVEGAIRTQLIDAGVVRVERERRLLLPARIGVRDTRAHSRLTQRVDATLRGPSPVARLDPRDTMLVALLAVGEVRTAITKGRLREAARRVAEMTARGGPVLPALRSVLQAAKSSS